MDYVGKSVGYVGKSVGYAAITHTFQPMKSIRSDVSWYKYRLLHAFECNTDIISRVNGEVISRGEAECNLAISE